MTNEINELIKKQAVTESELKRCQNDLNNLGTKVDATNDKADRIKNDLDKKLTQPTTKQIKSKTIC